MPTDDALPLVPVLPPALRTQLLTRVVAHYHRALIDHPEGQRLLRERWGLRDAHLFKTFQLGLASGSLMDVLPQDPATRLQLQALGVLNAEGHEFLRGCAVFPLWDAQGAITNLCGVPLTGPTDPLYLPGPRGLWNAQAARRGDRVLLVGSVVEALQAVDAGVPEAMPRHGVAVLDDLAQWLLQCRVRLTVQAGLCDEAVPAAWNEAGLSVVRLAWPSSDELQRDWNGPQADDARALLCQRAQAALAGLPTQSLHPGEVFEQTSAGFKLQLQGRRYEVKGIARVSTQLKATIKATGEARKGFELTTLDLYSARSRDTYARACATLFGVDAETIRADFACLIEHIEAWRAPSAGPSEAPAVSAADQARALAFLRSPTLLDDVLADLGTLGVAGEETNKLLCYLAVVSRKLDDPLSLLIQSRSAAGKSTLQHAVLALTPEEDQVHYTRLTSQALYYQGETQLAHKVLALEEAEGLGEAAYSLRALQSAKRLAVATTTKDPVSGQMRTQQYTVQGPVAVLLTTTSASLDEETASRFLTLTIDESRQMTETILAAQRQRETLAGYLAELDRTQVIAKHQAAQRLLEPLVVLNPYAEQLSFPAHSLRARRDHKKYLMLIKAVAFIHQHQRTVHTSERGGQSFRYIEATREDIAQANALAQQALGASQDELSAPARNLLRHIQAMVQAHCKAQDGPPERYVFTRRDIREATGWTEWQVRTHAKELEDLEYVRARGGTWGKEYLYELSDADSGHADQGMLDARRLVLTDPATLVDPVGAKP
jgi:DNA primase